MRTHLGMAVTGVLVACAIAVAFERAVAATQDPREPTRVDLGYDMGQPGGIVSLPIELTAPEGVSVGTTTNEIVFRPTLFAFEIARVPASVEADATATFKVDEANPDAATLQITVKARQGHALPNGIVAIVSFTISKQATEAQTVKLRNVARAYAPSAPLTSIEPVSAKDGEIEVLGAPPAVTACFFYMH